MERLRVWGVDVPGDDHRVHTTEYLLQEDHIARNENTLYRLRSYI